MENLENLNESNLIEIVNGQIINNPFAISTLESKQWNIQTIDEIGNLMPVVIHESSDFFEWPQYWKSLKKEFKMLVCGKDQKYDILRAELNKKSKKAETLIVSIISAAFASTLGLSAGLIAPFCALCLIALLKLGREAFCSMEYLDIPLKEIKK